MSEERRAKDRRPGERRTAPRASRPGSRASYAAHAAEGVRPTRHAGEEKRPVRRPGEYGAAEGSGAQARTPRPHSDRPADRRHPMAAPGANGRLHSTGASGASHALHAQAHSGHGLAPRSPRPRTAQSGLNARRLALDVLTDVREKGAYASLALGERLRAAHLSPEDRRLATGLVYGTLENQLQIDYALDRLMDHPTREPVQRDILRMGAYQILFLDRVPDSAAVDEAVKLTRAMGMEAACGFINAVLRNLSRGKDEIAWPDREADPMTYLSVMGSMPRWLVDKLVAAYGPEEAGRVILYREEEHPVCVRPNFTRLSDAEFEALLQSKDMTIQELQSQLTVAKQIKSEAEGRAKSYADEKDRLNKEILSLKDESELKIKNMQAMLDDKQNLNKALTDSCNSLKNNIDAMTSEYQKLANIQKELASTTAERDSLRAEKEQAEKLLNQALSEHKKAVTDLKEHENEVLKHCREQSQLELDKALLERDRKFQEQLQVLNESKQAEIDKYQAKYFELLEKNSK